MITTKPKNKFVLYRDLGNRYRWRLRSATGETLAVSSSGHPQKSDCEAELRTLMADRYAEAEVLDLTVARISR